MQVVKRYAKTSERVRQLSLYLGGQITHEQLERFLKAGGESREGLVD